MPRKPSEDPTKTRAATERTSPDGEMLIKTSIYMRLSVAKRLRVFCAERFDNMSNVIDVAVGQYLDRVASGETVAEDRASQRQYTSKPRIAPKDAATKRRDK